MKSRIESKSVQKIFPGISVVMIRLSLSLLLIPALLIKSMAMGCPHAHGSLDGHHRVVHFHLGIHEHGHHHHHKHDHDHDHHDDHNEGGQHPTACRLGCECNERTVNSTDQVVEFAAHLTSHCDHECTAIYLGSFVDFHFSQSQFQTSDLIRLAFPRFEWPATLSLIEQIPVSLRPPIPSPDEYQPRTNSSPLYLQILCLRI